MIASGLYKFVQPQDTWSDISSKCVDDKSNVLKKMLACNND